MNGFLMGGSTFGRRVDPRQSQRLPHAPISFLVQDLCDVSEHKGLLVLEAYELEAHAARVRKRAQRRSALPTPPGGARLRCEIQ